jgi:hypothetical protein
MGEEQRVQQVSGFRWQSFRAGQASSRIRDLVVRQVHAGPEFRIILFDDL